MTVARKFEHPFDFSNYAKLIFSANEIPRMKDKTGAVLDRMIIIPFDAVFTADSPDYDPFIREKLLSESSLEYCIQLGVLALKRVLSRQRFTESEAVAEKLKEYEISNDNVLMFLNEVEYEDVENQTTEQVYYNYKKYCTDNGLDSVSKPMFSKRVNQKFGLVTKAKRIDGKLIRLYMKE
jgi:putative DNA primase/helicase